MGDESGQRGMAGGCERAKQGGFSEEVMLGLRNGGWPGVGWMKQRKRREGRSPVRDPKGPRPRREKQATFLLGTEWSPDADAEITRRESGKTKCLTGEQEPGCRRPDDRERLCYKGPE